MTPVWLFDFLKKGSLESFFSTYYKALLQSGSQIDSERWFYVTEGTDSGMSVDLVDETAKRLLVDIEIDGVPTEKLIPVWNNRRNKSLNIIFVGDVDDNATHKHYLESIKFLLENRGHIPSPNIRFYALLWRPNSACTEPGLRSESIQFVRKLEALMNNNENHRFHKLLFFESSLMPEEKEKAIASMALAALHIATHTGTGDGDELLRSHTNIIYNAGAAGAFYEKQVQNEQEIFYLSNILLDAFVHGNDDRFVNPNQASEYIDKQTEFLEMFAPNQIAAELKKNCCHVPSNKNAYSVECEVTPFSLRLKEVWNKYYNNYLVHLKANLINKTKITLIEFVQNYKESLFATQIEFVNSVKKQLEDKVFEIFKNPDKFKAISIPQAIDILEKMRKRIAAKAKEMDSSSISSFVFPEYLKNAKQQVEAEIQNNDPSEAVVRLESILRRHPVYLLSMFVRAIVLGALLCYSGITFVFTDLPEWGLWSIGFLLFLLPIGVSFWSFKEYLIRINSLKDQYVACVLLKYQKELDADLKKCIAKTYDDIDKLCEWIKVRKLQFLQEHMSILSPPTFSFVQTARFQPLMKCLPYGASSEDSVLIPAMRIDVNTGTDMSGSFGKHLILDTPPVSKVNIQDDFYSFENIIQDKSQNLIQKLICQLLKSTAMAKNIVEQNVAFERVITSRTKLLLLDVSGSMSSSDMNELKYAVEKLSQTATIKWIAFNDTVVGVGDSSDEFYKIESNGGTNYIPAIKKAKEIIDSTPVDQVILISDGQPFETVSEILAEAYKLDQPLHTISIGDSGANVMKQISDMTSGEQIVVKEIKDLAKDVESTMNVIFTRGLKGEYTFAELMQKVYIPGCAEALHSYVSMRMESGVTTIGKLISECATNEGLREWENVSYPSCTFNNAIAKNQSKTFIQMVCDDNDSECVKNKFLNAGFENVELVEQKNIPEMIVSVLTLCPLSKFTDLQWANYEEK